MKFICRPKKEPNSLDYFRKHYSEWSEIYPNSKIQGKDKSKTTKKQDKQAKDQLKLALLDMQRRRCAYCEILLNVDKDANIEHFIPRSRGKGSVKKLKKDFEWDNLFISCSNSQSCGALKADKNPDGVFKPDELGSVRIENCLGYDADGEVFALVDQDEENARKANKTIDFFGLNCPSLVNKRKHALMLMRSKFIEQSSICTNEQECAEISANYVKDLQGFDGSCEFWQRQLDLLRDYNYKDILKRFLE